MINGVIPKHRMSTVGVSQIRQEGRVLRDKWVKYLKVPRFTTTSSLRFPLPSTPPDAGLAVFLKFSLSYSEILNLLYPLTRHDVLHWRLNID